MVEVFHVAAVAEEPGLRTHPVGATLGLHTEPAVCSDPDGIAAIRGRYPDGVSRHGMRYLTSANGSCAAEALFEAVRLAEAPTKPSRMESLFASESIADARAFIALHRRHVLTDIWRADAEVTHRGNMALLDGVDGPVIASLERGSAYWRGEQGLAPAVWELLVAPGMELQEIVESTAAPR